MVRVEMLAVGKELLIGRTLNTNAHWVGGRLARKGTMLKEVTTIDDDLEEISSAIRNILRRSPDFLVVVGGLGPTPDDMTLEGIAKGLGVKMKPNAKALALIKEHYGKRGMQDVELTPARRKMSVLPEGAEPVVNEVGTAPGVRLAVGGTMMYSLPGVPAEMKSIYSRSVEPEIIAKLGLLHRKYLRFKLEGILESVLAPIISVELRKHPAAYVKSHPRGMREGVSRIELDIAVVGEEAKHTNEEALHLAGEMTRAIVEAGGTVKSARSGRARRSVT
ncbi:MAG: molybdopterin-binding protein [Thaumarchaeota archaeon]|nr:molybdopterin-binding protein [Nitrososphaerota archaeon]